MTEVSLAAGPPGARCAPRDGSMAEILATVGDQVAGGTVLLMLEPDDG